MIRKLGPCGSYRVRSKKTTCRNAVDRCPWRTTLLGGWSDILKGDYTMQFRYHLVSFVRLARLKFLIYSPVMFTIGALSAFAQSPERFSPLRYVVGLLFVYATHIMTHFFNDYYDRDTDALNLGASAWTGGSRVLPEGRMQPKTALWLGRAMMLFAFVISCFPPFSEARYIAWATVFFAWAYSAPPLKLEARGLGEFTVALVLNTLVPILGCVLQQGSIRDANFLGVLVPLIIIEYVRMMVMNMADIDADIKVGKTTLVARLGLRRALVVHRVGLFLAYVGVLVAVALGLSPIVAVCLLGTVPFGYWLCKRLAHPVWISDNPFWASQHNGLSMLMGLVGLGLHNWSQFDVRALMLTYPLVVISFVAPKMIAGGRALLSAPLPMVPMEKQAAA